MEWKDTDKEKVFVNHINMIFQKTNRQELLKCSIATAQERINLQLLKSHVTVQKSAKVNFLNRYQTEYEVYLNERRKD